MSYSLIELNLTNGYLWVSLLEFINSNAVSHFLKELRCITYMEFDGKIRDTLFYFGALLTSAQRETVIWMSKNETLFKTAFFNNEFYLFIQF